MRRSVILAMLASGCGFRVGASNGGDDAPADAPSFDSPIDAAPDAFVQLPACWTNPAYTPGHGGHRYRKTTTMNYDASFDACAADGAHLAVVESMAENQFLAGFGGDNVWIGYNDLGNENQFRWVTGTSSFTAWNTSEPNDAGVEDCTYVASDGLWNDSSCDDDFQAICECEIGYQAPAPRACRTMATTDIYEGRKYFIRNTPLGWLEAKADCEAIGAHLVVFADDQEDDEIDNKFPGDSWIGLSDRVTEGTFVWVNDTPFSFTHWGALAPRANNPTRSCVRVNLDWNDEDCTGTKRYACECDPITP